MKAKKENVRNKSSARRKLIPAISMLTVSAIMLSTATYAWFTMSKVAEVDGIQMTATTAEGLEVSLGSDNTTFATDFNPTPSDEATEKSWTNKVNIAEYYTSFPKIKPSSTVDGKSFWNAKNASSGGKVASEFESVTATNTDNVVQQTSRNSSATNVGVTEGKTSYYVDIPVHLRSSKALDADSDIYCKMEIKNPDSGNASAALYKAVRIAFIPGTNGSTSTPGESVASTIWGVDPDTYGKEGDTQKAVSGANEKTAVTIKSDDDLTNGNTAIGVKMTKAENSGEYSHSDFTVRVWLEGESVNCHNANSGQQWNINMQFNLDTDWTEASGS